MPQVRNVSNDAREVPAYGLLVAPGDVMNVDPDDVDAWQYQEGVWELVDNGPPTPAPVPAPVADPEG